jgi:hypothetical protein
MKAAALIAEPLPSSHEVLLLFQNIFSEAHGGSWKTKLDWFFHASKHGV